MRGLKNCHRIRGVNGLQVLFPRQANSVFLQLSEKVQEILQQKGWRFYTFIGKGGCRFMCSWDTTKQDVRDLRADMIQACNSLFNHSEKMGDILLILGLVPKVLGFLWQFFPVVLLVLVNYPVTSSMKESDSKFFFSMSTMITVSLLLS